MTLTDWCFSQSLGKYFLKVPSFFKQFPAPLTKWFCQTNRLDSRLIGPIHLTVFIKVNIRTPSANWRLMVWSHFLCNLLSEAHTFQIFTSNCLLQYTFWEMFKFLTKGDNSLCLYLELLDDAKFGLHSTISFDPLVIASGRHHVNTQGLFRTRKATMLHLEDTVSYMQIRLAPTERGTMT